MCNCPKEEIGSYGKRRVDPSIDNRPRSHDSYLSGQRINDHLSDGSVGGFQEALCEAAGEAPPARMTTFSHLEPGCFVMNDGEHIGWPVPVRHYWQTPQGNWMIDVVFDTYQITVGMTRKVLTNSLVLLTQKADKAVADVVATVVPAATATLHCECGGAAANTTHAHWCPLGGSNERI